jgi:hypothetical protein
MNEGRKEGRKRMEIFKTLSAFIGFNTYNRRRGRKEGRKEVVEGGRGGGGEKAWIFKKKGRNVIERKRGV